MDVLHNFIFSFRKLLKSYSKFSQRENLGLKTSIIGLNKNIGYEVDFTKFHLVVSGGRGGSAGRLGGGPTLTLRLNHLN